MVDQLVTLPACACGFVRTVGEERGPNLGMVWTSVLGARKLPLFEIQLAMLSNRHMHHMHHKHHRVVRVTVSTSALPFSAHTLRLFWPAQTIVRNPFS